MRGIAPDTDARLVPRHGHGRRPTGRRPLASGARASREAQWRRLGLHLRSVTPRDILRLLLVAGALYAVLWLAVESWPALLPFVAGGLIGYAVLPIVNALDRVIPRPLARC